MAQHTYKKGRGLSGACARCGYIKSNETQHGHIVHSYVQSMWDSRKAVCTCGHRVTISDVPITVRYR